jgi:hypothetical protein
MTQHPTSLRLSREQRRFLRKKARLQKHNKIATVIKQLIDRAMQEAA